MLNLLRDRGVKKKIFIGLAVAVVASFVLSGVIVSFDEDKSASALARFEKRKITVSEYLDNYRAVQRQAQFMLGDKLNELRSQIDFKREAWDRLLLLEYAKKNGIRASDSEVVGWITRQQGFQRGGRFDDAYYRMYVEQSLRMDRRKFEEEIRQMLTLGKVQEKIESDASKMSDQDLKKLYIAENTEKDLAYGILPYENFQAEEPPQDELFEKLFAVVKEQSLAQGKTEEQARQELKDQMSRSEKVEQALKKLNDAREKMKSPADFESVLKAEGVTVERLASYKKGTYPAGVWPSENLQNAVANLEKDGISAAFDAPKAAMIVKVEAVRPPDDAKFEQEKEGFREKARSQSSRAKMDEALDGLREKLSLNVELMRELFPAEAPAVSS